MKLIDISRKLDENTGVYKGDPRFTRVTVHTVPDDGFMLSVIRMGTHTGTHIDAPCHFLEDSKSTYDLGLDPFVGECVVAAYPDSTALGFERILLKGGEALTESTARLIAKSRIKLLGTEQMSIGSDSIHRILLDAGIVILENADLSGVPLGRYMLSAAPLKIDADGCPVRAYLIQEDD